LARRGTTKRPFYHIVVADKAAPRDGKFVERIGHYNPRLAENKATFNKERAEHWLQVGARPTERVVKLFKLAGIDVPARLLDKQRPSAAKQRAIARREAERGKSEESPSREAAARAEARESAENDAAPAEG
jgi:small subunit ribosomal protein S16